MAISSIGMANFPFWGSLPMGYANYGGDTQIFNVPDYANTNVNIGFNAQAMASLAAPFGGSYFGAPQIQFPPVEDVVNSIMQPIMANLAKNNVNSVSGTIAATKQKLNSMLQTEGISDEDKEKVKALLERLDEQEKKLKELQNEDGLTNDEIYDRTKEIEKAMRDIAADTAQLKITPQSTKKNEPQGENKAESVEQEQAQQAQQTPQSQQAQQAQQVEQTPIQENQGVQPAQSGFFVDPIYAGQRAEMEAQMQQYVDQQTGGVRTAEYMAQEFRDAVNYTNWLGIPGTDDEKFNAICGQINKDNVMDLMLAYNRCQSTEDGESFMEAFMYDADGTQKPKYGKQIANALKEKALEVGVYDECRKDFAEIYDELGDFSIDNTIYKNYDNIIEKIAIAMGKPENARPYEK